MSRTVKLRSPFFIKVESSESARLLSRASLFLYVWSGTSTDKPATPTFTLAKSTNTLENFIVFDVADYCRDFIDVEYNGRTYKTDPVYVGVEVTKEYSNTSDTDSETFLFWGLDGYRDHADGLDGFFNLIKTVSPDTEDDDNDNLITPTVTMTANGANTATQSIQMNSQVVFSFSPSPPGSSVSLYRNNTSNLITTVEADVVNKTYTIPSYQSSDDGVYFAIASYTNTDASATVRESERSNTIALALDTGGVNPTLTPTSNTFTASTGDAEVYTMIIPSADSAPVQANVTVPSWLTVSAFNDMGVVGNARTITFTLTTNTANTAAGSLNDEVVVSYAGGTKELRATVTQAGAGFTAPTQPTITPDLNGVNTNVGNSGDAFVLTASGASDPEGGTLSYQWYLGGTQAQNRINGATEATYTTVENSAGTRSYIVAVTSSVSGLTTFSMAQSIQHRGGPSIAFTSGTQFDVATTANIGVTASDPAGGTLTYTWEIDDNGDGSFISLASSSFHQSGGGSSDTTATIGTITSTSVRVRVRATSSVTGLVSPWAGSAAGAVFTFSGSGSQTQNTDPTVSFQQSTDGTNFNTGSSTADVGTWIRANGSFTSVDNISRDETNESWTRYTDSGYNTVAETISGQSLITRRLVAQGVEYWRYVPNNELSSGPAPREDFTLTWIPQLIATWSTTNVSYNQEQQIGVTINFNKTAGIPSSDYRVNPIDTGDGINFISNIVVAGQTNGTTGTVTFDLDRNNANAARMINLRLSVLRGSQAAQSDLPLTQSGNVPGEITGFSISPTGSLPGSSDIATASILTDVSEASWRLTVNIPSGADQVFTGNGNEDIFITIPANPNTSNRNIGFTIVGVGATTLASGVNRSITRTQLPGESGSTSRGGQEV